jgi:hypothetical protein
MLPTRIKRLSSSFVAEPESQGADEVFRARSGSVLLCWVVYAIIALAICSRPLPIETGSCSKERKHVYDLAVSKHFIIAAVCHDEERFQFAL